MLVAHDASGPPAIDWALANPDPRGAAGAAQHLLSLDAGVASASGHRAVLDAGAPCAAGREPARARLGSRLFAWQVGGFIRDPEVRQPWWHSCPDSSWPRGRRSGGSTTTCSEPCSAAVGASRSCAVLATGAGDLRGQGPVPQRRGRPAVRRAVPQQRAAPAGKRRHYVQVDEPEKVADLITTE